jgi:1-acyl-sn-glycerol-3-phosphate acyltransferase
LSTHTGTAVLPVAHNAGEYWPRNGFLKYPGTISVRIGAPIDPAGMKPTVLNEKVQAWIETEMTHIPRRGETRLARE